MKFNPFKLAARKLPTECKIFPYNRYSTTILHRNQDNFPNYHIKCKMWHVEWLLRLVSQSTQIFQNSIENPKASRQDRRMGATSPPNCRNSGKASREKGISRPRTESSKMPHTRLLSCGCFSCQFAEGEKSLDRPIKEKGTRSRKIRRVRSLELSFLSTIVMLSKEEARGNRGKL